VTLLLDTNAVVALVEHNHRAVAQLVRESGEWPTISLITLGELLAGVAMTSTPTIAKSRRRAIRSTAQFRVQPIERASMSVYADVRRAGIRGNDALVVTAAVELDALLVTFDREFAAKADMIVAVSLIEM
jgi:predicted nucleic acid-binding protein